MLLKKGRDILRRRVKFEDVIRKAKRTGVVIDEVEKIKEEMKVQNIKGVKVE